MSDNDGNDISKLVILTLGIATIGFFAYLIYKEIRGYQVGGVQPATMSLADDNLFNLERKIHNLEMTRNDNVQVARQPVMRQVSGDYPESQHDNSGTVTRKVVSMGKQQSSNVPNVPNIQGLSKGDQDRVRRMFFNML